MHFEEEIRKRFSDFHFDSMLQSEKRDACATDLTDPLLEILGFKSFLLCFFFWGKYAGSYRNFSFNVWDFMGFIRLRALLIVETLLDAMIFDVVVEKEKSITSRNDKSCNKN